MTATFKIIKTIAPVVLVMFCSSFIAGPCLAQDTSEYQLSAPSNVNKSDTFILTVRSVKGTIDQKDVTIILPSGFESVQSGPTVASDGSLAYTIKAGTNDGDHDISVQINSVAGVQTLTQTVSVQRSFWEMYQPYFIGLGIIAVIALLAGSMTKSGSSSGGSGY